MPHGMQLNAMFGTPDDSAEELLELLLQNDIPEDIAKEVVSDVRG